MLELLWNALCPFTFVLFHVEKLKCEEEDWGHFVDTDQ
jgi:hypothetical protein